MPSASQLRKWPLAALVLCLFCLVLGAKLWVLDCFGSDLPNWDQWDAEGASLFLPYFQHHLGFLDFFQPQNEHRIFFTKLLSFCLLRVNGQWDSRLECVVNAALHSAFAVAVFLAARRLLAARWHLPFLAACALLFGLPISSQNILGGFHSQQYFLFWFSGGTIWLLVFSRAGSGAWWAGLVTGVLANFSMGSGLFAAAAVAGMLLLRAGCRQTGWRDLWPTLAGCAVAIGVGVLTRVPSPEDSAYQARSFHDFAFTVIHNLQWPNYRAPWHALVVYAPVILFLGQTLRKKAPPTGPDNLFLAAVLWLSLQYAATGYARGAGAPWPAPRYLDTCALGLLLNSLLLVHVFFSTPARFGWRIGGTLLCIIWLGTVGFGLRHHLHNVLATELPSDSRELHEGEHNVQAYLASGRDDWMDGRVVPYPSSAVLKERLSHPEIRAILPVSVRTALPLTGQAEPPGCFAPAAVAATTSPLDPVPCWGSYTGAGLAAQGEWHSLPLPPARGGYWKIATVGIPGTPGLSLELMDPSRRTSLAAIVPGPSSSAGWNAAYVPAPRTSCILVARDASASGWLGFSAPVSMAAGSYYAWRLVAAGRWLLFLSLGGVVLLLAGDLWTWRRR